MSTLQDPLRKIPGPRGLPLLGNVLEINPESMHNKLYDIARQYGPVSKISVFNIPIVFLNSTDACLEALVKKGELLQIYIKNLDYYSEYVNYVVNMDSYWEVNRIM